MAIVNGKILRKLEDGRIFTANVDWTNTFLVLSEKCDECFEVNLNKQEAQQLVNELQELVDTME